MRTLWGIAAALAAAAVIGAAAQTPPAPEEFGAPRWCGFLAAVQPLNVRDRDQGGEGNSNCGFANRCK